MDFLCFLPPLSQNDLVSVVVEWPLGQSTLLITHQITPDMATFMMQSNVILYANDV